MKLTAKQYEILTLVDDKTKWEGSERPGSKLALYFIPRNRQEWSRTLKNYVLLDPPALAKTLKAFARKGLIAPITRVSQYGCAITEQGLIALEEYREKHVYVNGKFPS